MNDNLLYPKNFYPTPREMIDKTLDGIDFKLVKNVLEPSAGKGDLALAIRTRMERIHRIYGYSGNSDKYEPDIDCVELDGNLRHILKGHGLRVVADDFLTFGTMKKYDMIVANPPFEDGDKHLLKMLDMQRAGGHIICLLNAETLRNPHTNTRKTLIAALDELNADISYISGAFRNAERKTDVDVALIKVCIPETTESFVLDELRSAALESEVPEYGERAELADRDIVKQIAREYAFVAEAARKLLDEYWGLRPYLLNENKDSAIEIMLHGYVKGHGAYESVTINEVLPCLRKRYWSMLFSNPVFTAKLTSNLKRDLNNRVDELANYDPNEYNIRTLQIEMAQQTIKGVEDTILELFDRLSRVHSYDGEHSKNVHYYDGWKTNKSWKINKKVIQPMAAFDEWRGKYTYYPGRCQQTLEDIEKVLTYLDTEKKDCVDIGKALKEARDDKNYYVELTYFDVQFYKKGTCHITFKDLDSLAKFNLYGSQRKGWLPPSYGKTRYADMSREEQSVIDDYEGEKEYTKVMSDPARYIVEPAGLLMLDPARV